MITGRPKKPLMLSNEERDLLETWASSRSLAYGQVRRAKIALMAGEGMSNTAIARKLGLSMPTIRKWRERYRADGIQGLYGEARPGRPRSISDEKVAAMIRKTLRTKPANATHWTVRLMAEQTTLSKSTVQQIWQAFGLQPHPRQSCHNSQRPDRRQTHRP